MRIQTLVHYNEETCLQYLNKLIKEDPKKAVKNVWKGIAPERLSAFNKISPGIQRFRSRYCIFVTSSSPGTSS